MFLRSHMPFEREAANRGRGANARLAARVLWGSVNEVVATRDERVGTTCLYRYPSPVGRRGFQKGRPPVFFRSRNGLAPHKQGLADGSDAAISRLIADACGRKLWVNHIIERERNTQCICETGSLGWQRARALPPAGILLANRPCWGLARARQRLSCWMARPEPVQSSGPLPTSLIANNTRRAAAKRVTPALAPNLDRKPARAVGRGGFFVAIAAGQCPQPRPEGTRNVQ